MAEELDEVVEKWVSLPPGQERSAAERAMVELARPIAVRAAKSSKLSASDAEDLAQVACEKLLAYLDGGERIERKADALVWRIGSNLAVDLHRSRARERKKLERVGQEAKAGTHRSAPEAFWLDLEQQKRSQAVVRELIEKAPGNYRLALEREMAETPLEEVAADHYRKAVAAGKVDESDPLSVDRAKRNARNLADKHLSRGRDWLRERIEERMAKGEL